LTHSCSAGWQHHNPAQNSRQGNRNVLKDGNAVVLCLILYDDVIIGDHEHTSIVMPGV
jgi:hypothetical protein